MAKINVQFHALPEEIIRFAEKFSLEFELHIAVMQFFPRFRLVEARPLGIRKAIEELNVVNRICLCNSAPDVSVNNAQDFMNKNPNCLALTIGNCDDEGLVESILAAKTDDPVCLKIWREIQRKLTETTLEGAWIINPKTGAKTFAKKHRFTKAAKNLESEGARMLPSAGWNHYLLNAECVAIGGGPKTPG